MTVGVAFVSSRTCDFAPLQVQTLYEEQESLLNSHMNAIQVR